MRDITVLTLAEGRDRASCEREINRVPFLRVSNDSSSLVLRHPKSSPCDNIRDKSPDVGDGDGNALRTSTRIRATDERLRVLQRNVCHNENLIAKRKERDTVFAIAVLMRNMLCVAISENSKCYTRSIQRYPLSEQHQRAASGWDHAFQTKRAGSHVHDGDQEGRSDRVAHLLCPEFISVQTRTESSGVRWALFLFISPSRTQIIIWGIYGVLYTGMRFLYSPVRVTLARAPFFRHPR